MRKRAKEDQRLLVPIKRSWLECGAVYGYRKVSDDLRELGEACGINRVHRLMRSAGTRSQTGYGKRKYKRGGAPSLVATNHLQRQFDVEVGRAIHAGANGNESALVVAALSSPTLGGRGLRPWSMEQRDPPMTFIAVTGCCMD
ncbi:IS3 family transposase [Massilia atriviolacea]